MKDDAGSKFVVLTTNRSGSVWMMSTLNGYHNVNAQGELFLPRPRVADKRWNTGFAYPRFIETRPDGLTIRPFSVFNYLNAFYSMPGSAGFKLMYAQLGLFPEILVYLVWHRIPVVHLVRRNHLDVMVSYAIKAKIGQAHLLSGQSAPEDLTIELDTERLIKKIDWLQKKQNLARTVLAWCRLPHIEVSYEDLLRNPALFDKIAEFLAIQPDEDPPQSSLVKIRKGGHRDVIRNYDKVKEVLASTKFIGLLE